MYERVRERDREREKVRKGCEGGISPPKKLFIAQQPPKLALTISLNFFFFPN